MLAELDAALSSPGSMSFVRRRAPMLVSYPILYVPDTIGEEPFMVLLADIIFKAEASCQSQLMEAYEAKGGNVTAVEPVAPEAVSSSSIVDIDESEGALRRMRSMAEKPKVGEAPSNLMITERYLFQPEVFDQLARQASGAGVEIQPTDSLFALIESQDFHALSYAGRSYDCGNKIGYLEAIVAHALADGELGGKARETIKALLG